MARSIKQDLLRLTALKRKAEDIGQKKKAADAVFKQHQTRVLERMEAEDFTSHGTSEMLYSRVEKIKGSVTDRDAYLRWCLENDEAFGQLADELSGDAGYTSEAVRYMLTELLLNGLTMCDLRERSALLNAQATAHVDDHTPLPPGMSFYPDPYISQRKR